MKTDGWLEMYTVTIVLWLLYSRCNFATWRLTGFLRSSKWSKIQLKIDEGVSGRNVFVWDSDPYQRELRFVVGKFDGLTAGFSIHDSSSPLTQKITVSWNFHFIFFNWKPFLTSQAHI